MKFIGALFLYTVRPIQPYSSATMPLSRIGRTPAVKTSASLVLGLPVVVPLPVVVVVLPDTVALLA